MSLTLVARDIIVTSADPAFKELSVRSRTQISKQIFAVHMVSAMKGQSLGCLGGSGVQIPGAANPALRVAGLGGVMCPSRGFPEAEPAKLHPKYKKRIFVGSVLNYLQVDDST